MSKPARILTIEDDSTIRANIVAYLEDCGFELLEAADGEQGLEVFREARPDLVLCDLRMPKLDGLEVLREITGLSNQTPVIVVSGVGMIDDAIKAMQRGAWDYITKPIPDMQVLEVAIGKALERARLLRENRAYQSELEQLNRDLSLALDELRANQRAGKEVQTRLLPPRDQQLGRFQFSHRLYPAMELSGDFVDYFAIDQGHIGFYMVDVSGHDAGSAFITVIVKALMSQLRQGLDGGDDTILDPDAVLRRLNQELLHQDLNKYVTLFYGVIDLATDRLQVANGGHYPPPFLYDGSQIRQISAKGKPVGLFDGVRYIGEAFQLPEDFLFLLVSDGIFELMPERSNRECCELLRNRVSTTRMTLDELMAEIGQAGTPRLLDDLTLLAINRQWNNVQ